MLEKVQATPSYHCVAEYSRIPNIPVINPLQAFVNPQTRKKKKNALHGLSSPNPNFSQFAIFGKKICRAELVDFNLPSN
jgi:hypothetical protein